MNNMPFDDANGPFKGLNKDIQILLKKFLDASKEGGFDAENLHSDDEVLDASKNVSKHMIDAISQQTVMDIMDWIEEGIGMAWTAKYIEQIVMDVDDISSSEESLGVQKKYEERANKTNRQSKKEINDFIDKTMDEICRNAFEGVAEKKFYSSKDMSSLMRVYARWLNNYLKLEGEDWIPPQPTVS